MRTRVSIALSFLILTVSSSARGDSCNPCHWQVGFGISEFHAGGAGKCNMCHTMHNSEDGSPVDPDNPGGNPWLLRDATPSDVCLSCHADWISHTFGEDPLSPPPEVGAGNFVFLLEDNLNDGHGGAEDPIPGDAAGHNILAPSRGVGPDGTLTVSPGGGFPSSQLGCSSCHDPHGTADFRMLYGAGRVVQDGLYTFTSPAPEAFGISIFHGVEQPRKHTAYMSGMSNWCGNCHGDFHDNQTQFVHPSGVALGEMVASAYNAYNGTEDQTGGSMESAYLPMVPFEDASAWYTSTVGPSSTSRVICTTCHRAHASSAPNAGRWDFNVTLLHEDGVESGSYPIPDPYQSINQRSLCNKCHVKDEFDRIE